MLPKYYNLEGYFEIVYDVTRQLFTLAKMNLFSFIVIGSNYEISVKLSDVVNLRLQLAAT